MKETALKKLSLFNFVCMVMTLVGAGVIVVHAETVAQYLKNGIYAKAGAITPTSGSVAVADGTSFVNSTTPTFDGRNVTNVSGSNLSGTYVVTSSTNAPTNFINIPYLINTPWRKAGSPNAYDDYFEANAAGWTAGNSATVSWAAGMMTVTGANSVQNQFREAYKTVPGTPYTITGLVYLTRPSVSSFHQSGVFLGDGTKLIVLVLQDATSSNRTLFLKKFTNANNGTQDSFITVYANICQEHMFYQIVNDGTTTTYKYSFEGVIWFTALSEAKGTYLGTIDRFGIVSNSANASESATALCPFVKLTSP